MVSYADPVAIDLSAEQLHARVGQIVAERGNITLAALAVNQNDLLKATTSVVLSGSIYLQARDKVILAIEETASDSTPVFNPLASRMGALTFGTGSLTEVAPDTASTRTQRDDQTFTNPRCSAPIPEPSEYTLMLAGLGMLGFMARRRLNNRV